MEGTDTGCQNTFMAGSHMIEILNYLTSYVTDLTPTNSLVTQSIIHS